ncbi:MAG TPA: hypothetical protein VNK24_11145 [Elusimicrobiota bacterium]|nr:hypothetical protein [Elusimicrobiota bacterium]
MSTFHLKDAAALTPKTSKIRWFLAFFPLAALCAGCGRKPFLYRPNAALWAEHGSQTPLFLVTAAVSPLRDLTVRSAADPAAPAHERSFNLTQSSVGSWPELSPQVLGRALTQELAADGLVSSAVSLEDPEHDGEFAALGAGARLYVSGAIERADVEISPDKENTLHLTLALSIFARAAKRDAFTRRILDKDYQEQATLDSSRAPDANGNAEANAALNRLFARAARDAAMTLKNPALQAKLGWNADAGSSIPPAPLGGSGVSP